MKKFATVLVLLLAIRVFEVQTVWADLTQTTTSFRESVRHIERGSKVLVAYADPSGGDQAFTALVDGRLDNATQLAALDGIVTSGWRRGARVSTP